MEINKELQELINKAVNDAVDVRFPIIKPAESFKCTKSLSEVIKAKNLESKDVGDGTLSDNLYMTIGKKDVNGKEFVYGSRSRESYRPTPEQLALINKTAKEDQTETSGYVFPLQATNLFNRPDRRKQLFNNTSLSKMANKAVVNTIPWLFSSPADCEDHAWKADNGKGYVISAYAKDGGLFYDAYVPEEAGTIGTLNALFNGRINKLSVGFALNPADVLCSSCKTKSIYDDSCMHMPGEPDENGQMVYEIISDVTDNYEISAVAVPCQAEARVSRSLDKDINNNLQTFGTIKTLTFLNKSVELIPLLPAEEKSEIDKINNGKNTIEDNSLMSVENQEPVQEPTQVEAPVETKEAPQPVEMAEDTKFCKLAESIKSAAVKEVNESMKALLDESFKSVFAKLAEMEEKAAKDTKNVKKAVKKALKKFNKELELQASVPGSKSLVDATRASGENPLSASADKLLEKQSQPAETAEPGLLDAILRS